MALYAAAPPEASHCLLSLEVASPAQTPRGPAGTWLSRSTPCMQNSGASVGFFLPDTHTVFLQRQNLIPAVQGTTLKPPLLLQFHLCVEDFASPCSPSSLAGTFSMETPALCVLGSWIRSCAEHLRGPHWCGSLSNVGGGVLESGKQPAEFHNPTPGSLLSAFQGTNGCGWTVVRTLGSPAQPTYQLFAIICLHACVCS